jgi:hypothetical protein
VLRARAWSPRDTGKMGQMLAKEDFGGFPPTVGGAGWRVARRRKDVRIDILALASFEGVLIGRHVARATAAGRDDGLLESGRFQVGRL